jgi:hypothetical protein
MKPNQNQHHFNQNVHTQDKKVPLKRRQTSRDMIQQFIIAVIDLQHGRFANLGDVCARIIQIGRLRVTSVQLMLVVLLLSLLLLLLLLLEQLLTLLTTQTFG